MLVMVFLSLAAGSFLFTAFFSLLPDAWRRARRNLVLSLGVLGFLLMLCLTRLVGALGQKRRPRAAGKVNPNHGGDTRLMRTALTTFPACLSWKHELVICHLSSQISSKRNTILRSETHGANLQLLRKTALSGNFGQHSPWRSFGVVPDLRLPNPLPICLGPIDQSLGGTNQALSKTSNFVLHAWRHFGKEFAYHQPVTFEILECHG